jgi:hypothetical protein
MRTEARKESPDSQEGASIRKLNECGLFTEDHIRIKGRRNMTKKSPVRVVSNVTMILMP